MFSGQENNFILNKSSRNKKKESFKEFTCTYQK